MGRIKEALQRLFAAVPQKTDFQAAFSVEASADNFLENYEVFQLDR